MTLARARGPLLAPLALLVAGLATGTAPAVDPAKPFHQYVRDSWSVEAGLPQLSAMAMAQTADGYIWVGTQRGLARFDGARFRVYQRTDTPQLPSVIIESLFVDSRGWLWIGTQTGIAKLEPGGTIERVSCFDADGKRPLDVDVTDFEETAPGNVVAATSAGLMREAADGSMRLDRIIDRTVYALEMREDGLWLGGDGRVIHQRPGLGNEVIALPGALERVPVIRLERRNGELWAGTEAGLWLIEGGAARPAPVPPGFERSQIRMLFTDRAGTLWIGGRDGLLRSTPRGTIEAIAEPALTFTESALEDDEGNLWFGSRASGIHRLWDGWVERYSRLDGLDRPVVWSIAPRRAGGLWVGTSAGVRVFEGRRFNKPPGFDALEKTSVVSLLEEADQLLLGTNLGIKVHRNGRIEELASAAQFRSQRVYGMARDRAGALVAATAIGAFRETKAGFVRIPSDPPEDSHNMRSLLVASDGRLYAAALGGLFAVEDELRRVPSAGEGRVAQGIVMDPAGRLITSDSSGQLWVQQAGVLKPFGPAQGVPENFPGGMAIDRRGVLWVSGLLGLYRVPLGDFDALAEGRIGALRAAMVLSITGRVPGAQHSFCCNGAGSHSTLLQGDDLWLTSPDGIVRVPTTQVSENQVIPKAHVERLQFAEAWHEASPDALVLPLGARDVAFEFTVNSFRDPKSVGLMFMLEGYDHDWRRLDDVKFRRANYTNLPPGEYTFRVRGANDSGAWSEHEATQRFTVPARLHETPWFFALLLALAAAVGYRAYLWRVAHLRQDRERLALAVAQRTEELAEANRQLLEASETDPLTKLKNRRFLYDQLPADIANLHRRMHTPGAERSAIGFLMVDADHFKRINDAHGHDVGDDVLRRLSNVLRGAVRPGDFVVRWGGEEFLLVLRDLRAGDLALVAENIRSAVAAAEFLDENKRPFEVTASLGGIEYPLVRAAPKLLSWQKHVELADLALYEAKKAGRNTWALKVATREAADLLTTRLANGPTVDLVSAGVAETQLRS